MTNTDYSIIQPTGNFGSEWPDNNVIPQGRGGKFSSAGWTTGNEGFQQQTFLGASVREFNVSAGFGDTTSSLGVLVVNDEYNASDATLGGDGDDAYHSGVFDNFAPPVVGSPVFFKFGKNFATVEQAWRKTFDDIYGYNTIEAPVFPRTTSNGQITSIPDGHYLISSSGAGIDQRNVFEDRSSLLDPDNDARGSGHFVFGGILQSYTQTRGIGGNPTYTIDVQDPREILSNATLILRNYAGTTFNNKNLFNIYGFLEYDISNDLQSTIDKDMQDKSELTKVVDNNGDVTYVGQTLSGGVSSFGVDNYQFNNSSFSISNFPNTFPITGQGYARVSQQGVPIYRIKQAIDALFETTGSLPDEYKEKGFGGAIDFRGYKYVVDLSGIPFDKIPAMYFMNFDQIDLMSFVQELSDIISHDLFVSLLPVIDHPAASWLYNKNQYYIDVGLNSEIITGIIRIDVIDRSQEPTYGAIKSYIDNLSSRGIYVENQDVGYEVSNVVTDKFVVGAQEVEMYYFTNNKDRDNLELRKLKDGESNHYEALQRDQWSLSTMLQQQVIPFYGFLDKDAVTIPRGFGGYQQIMLDSSSLDAYGVGNYYIATEMELRAASVSYEKWRDFLLLYDEVYIQELTNNQTFLSSLAGTVSSPIDNFHDPEGIFALDKLAGRDFGVSVPRCVFNSEKDFMGDDGYPASQCSPPYGYPLYYKRAEKIGIPEAGLAAVSSSYLSIITNLDRLEGAATDAKEDLQINQQTLKATNKTLLDQRTTLSPAKFKELNDQVYAVTAQMEKIKDFIRSNDTQIAVLKGVTERPEHKRMMKLLPSTSKSYLRNARKVYDFIKEIADQNLGKKFLVKIPQMTNLSYNDNISIKNSNTNQMDIDYGPFGFKPIPINSDQGFSSSPIFINQIQLLRNSVAQDEPYEQFLSLTNNDSDNKYIHGALKTNFNPITERWEFNYAPEPQGGFFNFNLYNRNLSFVESLNVNDSQLSLVTRQFLTPRDLTNFASQDNRIASYVRFNHSQFLDFTGMSKGDISQQVLTEDGFVPDIMEEINNLNPDQSEALDLIADRLSNNSENSRKPEAVAFVKCSVEPRFYMPPKVVNKDTVVWARDYEFVPNFKSLGVIEIEGENGCKVYKAAQEYAVPIFKVPYDESGGFTAGGADGTTVNNEDFARRMNQDTGANIVQTQVSTLNPDHVYALITIPGRVSPSVDSRYLDGPYKAFNAPKIYNLLTADVVKNVAGFEKPEGITNKAAEIDCDKFTTDALVTARQAQVDASKGLALDLPEGALAFTAPSPVYPDVIALPLMSNERCYGPWLSSTAINPLGDDRIRYFDIGGKVEFIKDETLAPWNYGGYQLMNDAGLLQAQFSNSLLLFTERGGFVIPEAPTGIALATALQKGGPLVTSISVGINNDSIRTTVKMDTYTPRFGKLRVQKEGAIAQIRRERQLRVDQNNSLIRQGLKNIYSSDLSTQKFDGVNNIASNASAHISQFQKGQTVYSNLVTSAKRTVRTVKNIETGEEIQISGIQYGNSMQSPGYLEEALGESQNPDIDYQSLAGGSLPFEGYSETPGDNGYFPSMNYRHTRAISERVYGSNFETYTPPASE